MTFMFRGLNLIGQIHFFAEESLWEKRIISNPLKAVMATSSCLTLGEHILFLVIYQVHKNVSGT